MPGERLIGWPTINWNGKEGFAGQEAFRLRPGEWARGGQKRGDRERHHREESLCTTGVRVDPNK